MVVCPFVLFLLAIVLSALLRLMDSDYLFGILKLFLNILAIRSEISVCCCDGINNCSNLGIRRHVERVAILTELWRVVVLSVDVDLKSGSRRKDAVRYTNPARH